MSNNLICAVDIETTGLDPRIHEIIDLAIIPLDMNWGPDERYSPFNQRIRAEHPESAQEKALEKHGLDINQGASQKKARDNFISWLGENNITGRIQILGHNAGFDLNFLKAWTGNIGSFFHYLPIDTLQIAQAVQLATDFTYFQPYPDYKDSNYIHSGLGLPPVALELGVGIQETMCHTANHDARTAAKVAKRLFQIIRECIPY